ncbi:MAG: hypothetical protein ACYCW5_03960 [Thermoleophilia bacterium]
MKLFQKIDNWYSAAAFAEAGEFEAAREIAAEDVSVDTGRTTAEEVKPGTPRLGRGRLAPKA